MFAPSLCWLLATAAPAPAVQAPPVTQHLEPTPRSDPPRSQSTGVAVSVGAGTGFGPGFGAQVAVPIAVASGLLQVGPYVGFGFFPGIEESRAVLAPSVGVLGFWGVRHRIFVDLDFGVVALRQWQLHGTIIVLDAVYGPSALVGYEFMAHRGMFVRIGVGGGLLPEERVQLLFAATLAWGWKF
jgi:hypothetical protein